MGKDRRLTAGFFFPLQDKHLLSGGRGGPQKGLHLPKRQPVGGFVWGSPLLRRGTHQSSTRKKETKGGVWGVGVGMGLGVEVESRMHHLEKLKVQIVRFPLACFLVRLACVDKMDLQQGANK